MLLTALKDSFNQNNNTCKRKSHLFLRLKNLDKEIYQENKSLMKVVLKIRTVLKISLRDIVV